jgi:hypothetical protein
MSGMFDNVSLTPAMRKLVQQQYKGHKEIDFDGWQTKSLDRSLSTVTLADDGLMIDGEPKPFTGSVVFYKNSGIFSNPQSEWLEFTAVYVDGQMVAVRHVPNERKKGHKMDMSAQAVIEGDAVVIRLPIANLPVAVSGAASLGTLDPPFKVTDASAFAKDLVRQLNDEDDEGTTMVHKMFDQAFNDAAEQGADGITEFDDTDE